MAIPTAITDFASSIQAICNSQLDVQELVSKWADIIDDVTPKTVEIHLTNGQTLSIKNMAMVEGELREAVRETYPNINKSRVSFTYGSPTSSFSAIYGATASHGQAKLDKSLTTLSGWTQSPVNDFVTYHPVEIPTGATSATIRFSQLPRLVMLGIPTESSGGGLVERTTTSIEIDPIPSNSSDFDLKYNVDANGASDFAVYYYSCVTRFINHSSDNDHMLELCSSTTSESKIKIKIPKRGANAGFNYADVLFFAGKGLDAVNILLLNGGGAEYYVG